MPSMGALRIPAVRIHVKNYTPMLVGWYEPSIQDHKMGIRPTGIKGLWRWWARALVGGILYDLGYLGCERDEHALCKPSRDSVKLISRIVGDELGLGSTSKASIFRLYTQRKSSANFTDTKSGVPTDESGTREYAPEMIIRRHGLAEGQEFDIVVEIVGRRDGISDVSTATALGTLILALQLMGVGRSARRGFGSLDIVRINADAEAPELVKQISSQRDLRSFINGIYESCKSVVEKTVTKYEKECREQRVGTACNSSLPPMPVLSKCKVKDVPISTIKIYSAPRDAFKYFCEFFVKKKRLEYLKSSNLEQYEWFLGLPRQHVYHEARRASPILLAFHGEENIFGNGAFVTMFLSCDWPKKVTRGMNDIMNAYQIFMDKFNRYVRKVREKVGIGDPIEVWP